MKPGTFTQMYIQLVFAVKNREALLHKNIQNRVFEYMSGIITGMKHKSIIGNGMPNHVHILIGLHPSKSVSETVYTIKRSSSLFINKEKLCLVKFECKRVMAVLRMVDLNWVLCIITFSIRKNIIKRSRLGTSIFNSLKILR